MVAVLSGDFWGKYTKVVRKSHQNIEQETRRVVKDRNRRLFRAYLSGWDDAETKRFPGPQYLTCDDERKQYLAGFDARKEKDALR